VSEAAQVEPKVDECKPLPLSLSLLSLLSLSLSSFLRFFCETKGFRV